MFPSRQPAERRVGLRLSAGRDPEDPAGGQIPRLLGRHHQAVGPGKVTSAPGDARVRRDRASEGDDEPPCRLRNLAEQSQPMHVRREQSDDDPPGRRFDEPLERSIEPVLAPELPGTSMFVESDRSSRTPCWPTRRRSVSKSSPSGGRSSNLKSPV